MQIVPVDLDKSKLRLSWVAALIASAVGSALSASGFYYQLQSRLDRLEIQQQVMTDDVKATARDVASHTAALNLIEYRQGLVEEKTRSASKQR